MNFDNFSLCIMYFYRFIKIFGNKKDPDFENGLQASVLTTLEASI